jgi:LysM repeat protein/ABC-type branched-subunit amino acid transport system substrate-binding protein
MNRIFLSKIKQKPTSQKYRALVCFVFLFILLFASPIAVSAQRDGTVKKSTKTEIIDGKKYYLHTVERGQTLYAIAKAYDLTVNDVLVENPDALNGIKTGQVLRIPAQKPIPKPTAANTNDTAFFVHKVEPGQTLYSICKLYNVREDDVIKLNPAAKMGLQIGQELRIPGKKTLGTIATVGQIPVSKNLGDTTFIVNKKALYHVALMLPLQLWNTDNIEPKDKNKQFSAKSEAAVSFYEGALLAVDSMRKRGMNVKLHVYDVDESDSSKVLDILKKPEFNSMDLILGPLSPGPFYAVSQWAKEHHVAVVSPISPANRVLFKRPDAVKALPSTSTQMEQLAIHIAATHKADNIVIVASGNPKEQAATNSLRTALNKLLFPTGNDSIRLNRGMAGLEALLKKDKANIIVVPSGSQVFVSDLMRSMQSLIEKYPITVYGMSTWMGFDNLDFEYLQKANLHFVSPYFIDYDSSDATKRFLKKYDETFEGDANSYVFTGYDVSLFFLSMMYEQGTFFYQKMAELKGEGLQQRFEFVRSDAESGYENKGVRIVRMVDYKLKEVPRK